MFSIYEISLIKRSDSRKYFEDVLQSYYSKNYRATILLLYSLTIDDLYYKLMVMNDRKYENLSEEIQKIEELSKNASKYSEIEDKIYKIYKEKNILNHDTMDTLEFFKKIRNKCAHPSFFKDEKYDPLSEEVYMIIKRVYHDILTKEAFIKDPYKLIKSDIENKEWGNITDVIMGFKTHEEHYAIFSLYFRDKYFEKFTDNNFEKLFSTLIKLIILKKDEWSILNQYKNMLLMESIIKYLYDKGKISILHNKYEWSNIMEDHLIDDNDKNLYKREWFALTNMYKILQLIPNFVDEINRQNHSIFKYLQSKLLGNIDHLVDYWNLFYEDFNEIIEPIKGFNTNMYYELLEKAKFLKKEQKIKILNGMLESIPETNGFDNANLFCTALISQIRKENLKNKDIEEILEGMNDHQQIYSKNRNNSQSQINTIKDLAINLDKYINLKELLGD